VGILQRVIGIEKSSFNPLVFTRGRMAPECAKVNKSHYENIAAKRMEPYASVMTYIEQRTLTYGQ